MKKSADMTLKPSRSSSPMNYIITIHTMTEKKPNFNALEQHHMDFGDTFITMNQKSYEIIGENKLKEAIETLDLEWTQG